MGAQPNYTILSGALSALANDPAQTSLFFQAVNEQQRLTVDGTDLDAALVEAAGEEIGNMNAANWSAFKTFLENNVGSGDLQRCIELAQTHYLLAGGQDADHILEQRYWWLALAILWKTIRKSFASVVAGLSGWRRVDNNKSLFPATGVTFDIAYPNNVTAGNLLICCVAGEVANGLISTITDTVGSAWNMTTREKHLRDTTKFLAVAWALAGASGANTLTVTLPASTSALGCLLHEFAGASAGSVDLDGYGTKIADATTAPNGAWAADSILVTNVGNLEIGFIVDTSGNQADIVAGTKGVSAHPPIYATMAVKKGNAISMFSEWFVLPGIADITTDQSTPYVTFSLADHYMGMALGFKR